MQIETERLILKAITENDWDIFEKLHKDTAVIKYVSDAFTEADIKNRFQSRLVPWQKTSSNWLTLTIFEKTTGNKIGVTGFYPEWQPYQQAELGFLLCPDFQGKGYGQESTIALLDYAFNTCSFHKVSATVTEGNIASVSLLKKIGFTHEGTIRDNFKLANKWHNDLKFGLLSIEYNGIFAINKD